MGLNLSLSYYKEEAYSSGRSKMLGTAYLRSWVQIPTRSISFLLGKYVLNGACLMHLSDRRSYDNFQSNLIIHYLSASSHLLQLPLGTLHWVANYSLSLSSSWDQL